MSDKVFWIGDDGDNKSVNVNKKIYGRGDEIPADNIDKALLDKWKVNGLISVGEYNAPIVISDKKVVDGLEAEIRSLKADLDKMPALQKEIKALTVALEKAKSGKKADASKALEADVKGKAALIEKQAERIVELEKQVEDLTKPDSKSADEGGAPGFGKPA